MADFAAVLRKTIDGLGDSTPETRERVYAKARATIAAKLAALNPPPPPAVAERQKKALEDAIAEVEAEHRAAEEPQPEPDQDLEAAIAGLGFSQAEPAPEAIAAEQRPEPGYGQPAPEPDSWSPDDEEMMRPEPVRGPSRRRRSLAPLAAGLAVAVALAGAGYAAWINKDEFAGLFGSAPEVVETQPLVPAEPAQQAAEEPAQQAAEEPAAEVAAAPEEPSVSAEPAVAPQAEAQPEEAVVKFTQRLRPDGTEIDEGPADGEAGIGEGTSIAVAAAAPQTPPPLEAPQPDPEAASAGDEEVETQPLVAVAQKAIFYEERTSADEGSAEDGSIVWSLVQESPGGDLPPEPAIRAEATIPGKDLQLRMTIRRNADQTLPASHIVEMIFLTPENFEGGGIDNVLRIALKESEQAAGNPLLGIPAKIADGFFLVALTDSPAEIQANTTMLRRQSWIDIPIVYRSGRRALITLEKGIPGDKVFDEALNAWQAARSG